MNRTLFLVRDTSRGRDRSHNSAQAPIAAVSGSPARLADQLTLLFEGTYSSVLTFGHRGPAHVLVDAAAAVIEA